MGVESSQGLAGARLLTETSRVTGLDNEVSRALSAWWGLWAVHDSGKVMADLTVCVALGGRCLLDLSVLRSEKDLQGRGLRCDSLTAYQEPWPTTSRRSRSPSAGPARRYGSGCGPWPKRTPPPLVSRRTGRW